MNDSMYHRVLRVSAVVCALVLLFESGFVTKSTAQLFLSTHQYLASAVGMSTLIEPTEHNTLTAEFMKQRETPIKEIEIGLEPGSSNNSTYILASILFVLLVLIILNYVINFVRTREFQETRLTNTLS